MDPRDVVDAYLQGRIESWGVFRRLRQLGLTTATALAVAAALPAAVSTNDAAALKDVGHTAQESPLLDLLMSHLASQLEKVEAGGPIRPLAATLARIGANNLSLPDCGGNDPTLLDANRNDCGLITLDLNDGFNNLSGELVADPTTGNLKLTLGGSIGQSHVNLFGFFDLPDNQGSGNHVGKVHMALDGNIGDVPLSLHGNLGNLSNRGGNTNSPQ